MALETITCPDCDGWGEAPVECEYCVETTWDCEAWADCHRCMGAGEVEVQRGPEDPDGEVSDRPRPGSPWAVFARWEQEREQQG